MINTLTMMYHNGAEFSRRTIKIFHTAVSESFLVPIRHLPRVLFHGTILAIIICGFWLLDSLKDPVLAQIVGIEYQPIAKLLSVVVTLLVTCIYDFLTSYLNRPNLFHLVSVVFGIVMMIISALLSDPERGLGNRGDRGPHRILGWCAYFTTEVYGSLMVALFWSFTNSVMDLEQAKGAYGLIISVAQVGAIVGSTFATQAKTIGIPQLFLMSAMTIFSVSLLIKIYHITYTNHPTMQDVVKRRGRGRGRSRGGSWVRDGGLALRRGGEAEADAALHALELTSLSATPPSAPLISNASAAAIMSEHGMMQTEFEPSFSERENDATTTPPPPPPPPLSSGGSIFSGFYEGLSLILRHKYVALLLGVSCLYEVVVTVLDYQFKILGADSVALHADSILDGGAGDGDRFANLLGHFGQVTNMLSFLVSFFGFSFLVRYIGVKASLMVFPCVLFLAVLLTNLVPSLRVLFISVSVIKALIFSLHDPVKELLYIPTSQSIKFKAKAWIDVFGSRLAKAGGSFITNIARGKAERLRNVAEIPCLVLSLCIVAIAWTIGNEFQRLVDQRIVIGGELDNSVAPKKSVRLAETWGSRSGSYDYNDGGALDCDDDEDGPEIDGLRPGDVGYPGYNGLKLHRDMWPEEDADGQVKDNNVRVTGRNTTFL